MAVNPEYLPNKRSWSSEGEPVLAARLFVGFNVGDTPTYDLDDLVRLVRESRPDKPNATFVAQKGIYQHRGSGGIVEEDGGQVIVVDIWGTTRREFEREMEALAERIASEMQQEEVVVEIQQNGLTQSVFGVSAG